jgi:hypothetical protein
MVSELHRKTVSTVVSTVCKYCHAREGYFKILRIQNSIYRLRKKVFFFFAVLGHFLSLNHHRVTELSPVLGLGSHFQSQNECSVLSNPA